MRNIVNSGWKSCSVRYALIVACAGAGQLAGVAGAPGSIRARDLKLTLVTYDHVRVGGEILAGAENTASKIFRPRVQLDDALEAGIDRLDKAGAVERNTIRNWTLRLVLSRIKFSFN